MKALVIHAARDLRLEERPEPVPGPGEVLLQVALGGVCGSDLHYYNHGGFGAVRLREPMVLGPGITGLSPGDLVAVSPSRPCGHCDFCKADLQNHCPEMRFYGSAMPFPHVQGAFRQHLVADARQCVKADGLSAAEAAMAEPLAVALHAIRRAGGVDGKRVLITGCGPIGALVLLAARAGGAGQVVVTDLSDFTLDFARRLGAERVLNLATDPGALAEFQAGKGHFDVHVECSGSAAALAGAIPALRPRGVIVQAGLGGDMAVPMQALTAKELELRGTFRFHAEFAEGVALMQAGRIDVSPLVTHTLPLARAEEAFRLASDRSQAMKAQIAFGAAETDFSKNP
jgi:L-idonate 5-dehydrogenase